MDSNERYLRKNIGKKIKLARAKTNFTQEKLAEELSLSTRYITMKMKWREVAQSGRL